MKRDEKHSSSGKRNCGFPIPFLVRVVVGGIHEPGLELTLEVPTPLNSEVELTLVVLA
jgi:hypothetical protein